MGRTVNNLDNFVCLSPQSLHSTCVGVHAKILMFRIYLGLTQLIVLSKDILNTFSSCLGK